MKATDPCRVAWVQIPPRAPQADFFIELIDFVIKTDPLSVNCLTLSVDLASQQSRIFGSVPEALNSIQEPSM